jgi:hypothetical protein
LPFELAGAISEWQVELSTDKELRQFDYSTISDVILQLKYTARESGGLFKDEAAAYIKNFLSNAADLIQQPLAQMFSMKHEFPTEWRKFMLPSAVGAEQILRFTPGKNRFPFLTQNRDIVVMKLEVLAKCTQATSYHTILSYFRFDDDPESDDPVTSTPVVMPQNNALGGLNKATINVSDAGMNLEELDITKEMRLKMKRGAALDFKSLVTEPEEVDNVFIVIHYKLN